MWTKLKIDAQRRSTIMDVDVKRRSMMLNVDQRSSMLMSNANQRSSMLNTVNQQPLMLTLTNYFDDCPCVDDH